MQVETLVSAETMYVDSPPEMSTFAASVFDECSGNIKDAELALQNRLMANIPYLKQLTGEIAHEAIRRHVRSLRGRLFPNTQVPRPEPKQNKKTELKEAKRMAGKWLTTFYLSTGKPLGAATRGEVLAQAGLHEAQAAGNLLRARVMRGVAERMPDDVTSVASVLTDDEIEEIARGES